MHLKTKLKENDVNKNPLNDLVRTNDRLITNYLEKLLVLGTSGREVLYTPGSYLERISLAKTGGVDKNFGESNESVKDSPL